MAEAATAARLSTIITFTLRTTTCIRVGLPPTGHPMVDIRPTVDIHVQDISRDRCLIRPPGQPTMVASLTIVLTIRQFQRRGLTTKRPPGRPIRKWPNLIFPRRARFLTIRAVLI